MATRDRVTRSDIESKLTEISGQVEERADEARSTAVVGAVAGGTALTVLAYLLGRRRGKRRSTVVEVRRV